MEELVIACRYQKPGAGNGRRRADQRLQVPVGFAHGMCEIADLGGIAGDPAEMLDYRRGVLRNRVRNLAAALKAVQRRQTALQAPASPGSARRTTYPERLTPSDVPCMTDSGSRVTKPSFV